MSVPCSKNAENVWLACRQPFIAVFDSSGQPVSSPSDVHLDYIEVMNSPCEHTFLTVFDSKSCSASHASKMYSKSAINVH